MHCTSLLALDAQIQNCRSLEKLVINRKGFGANLYWEDYWHPPNSYCACAVYHISRFTSKFTQEYR
jgi:hypothetical protein